MGKMYSYCYLMPQENCRYTNYCPLLSVRDTSLIGTESPDQEFTAVSIRDFIPDSENEVINQPGP